MYSVGYSAEARNPRHLTHVWDPGAHCGLQYLIPHNMALFLQQSILDHPPQCMVAGVQEGWFLEDKPWCTSIYQLCNCFMCADIWLAKVSHMANPSQCRSWLPKDMSTGRHAYGKPPMWPMWGRGLPTEWRMVWGVKKNIKAIIRVQAKGKQKL